MPPKLVFIHGWGFDAGFWDPLAAHLAQFSQSRIDLGFYGAPADCLTATASCLLIGHSLGFMHGITNGQGWRGWIAVNGFSRFIHTPAGMGCLPPAQLRAMRAGLNADAQKTLSNFYKLVGTLPPSGAPVPARLGEGLDALRDMDIHDTLSGSTVPGLVLAADDDPLVPAAVSHELGRFAGDGNLRMHAHAGHLLPLTRPAWCAEAIYDFIAGHMA
ncbi:MAG: alpha/beta fold hydrolase [Bdellovibrionales bacterium]